MNRRKRIAFAVAALLVCIIAIGCFIGLENNNIGVTNHKLRFAKLPQEFDGFKVLQISDLHGKEFGREQKDLVEKIRKCRPDIIVVTGDLIERNNYDDSASMKMIEQAVKIAPIYFVTGNHEWQSHKFSNELEPKLVSAGIRVLRDSNSIIKNGDTEIAIMGIDDVSRFGWSVDRETAARNDLQRSAKGLPDKDFKILLAHRPEMAELYEKTGVDLVFAGHTHGGQIRIPLIGAVYAPDQGFFPDYAAGSYRIGKTELVVSRGLGTSIIPFRIFCDPELVLLTLEKE